MCAIQTKLGCAQWWQPHRTLFTFVSLHSLGSSSSSKIPAQKWKSVVLILKSFFYTRVRNKRTATYIKFLDFFPGVRKFNSFFFFETIFMAVWSLRGWKGTSIVFTFWNLELAQVNENMENMVLQTFNCVCTASRKT